jgi:chromosome segregation ATPase
MDSAFNQPTSTTPRRNWQLDQCYREGCKLERELAEAQNLLKQCLSAMPVGYIPTHTAENLPEMICDLAKALAEETTERENLERELAAVTEQRDRLAEELDALKQSMLDLSHPNMKLLLEERNEARTSSVCTHGTTTASAQGWALKHEAVTEQRDRLAEALESVKCELGVPQPEYPSPVANAYWIADEALQSLTPNEL